MRLSSPGFENYLFLMTRQEIESLEEFGYQWVAQAVNMPRTFVQKTFFSARRINHELPESFNQVHDELWPQLIRLAYDIRLILNEVEQNAYQEVVDEAVSVTLQMARDELEQAFEVTRGQGKVDFRLKSILRAAHEENAEETVIREAFLRKRASRFASLMSFEGPYLNESEKQILSDVQETAQTLMDGDIGNRRIDSLLVLARVLAEISVARHRDYLPRAIRESFHRMTEKTLVALGALVYEEQHRALQRDLGIPI